MHLRPNIIAAKTVKCTESLGPSILEKASHQPITIRQGGLEYTYGLCAGAQFRVSRSDIVGRTNTRSLEMTEGSVNNAE